MLNEAIHWYDEIHETILFFLLRKSSLQFMYKFSTIREIGLHKRSEY